jgi:uncharacterized membrane protein (DUF485 family)
MTKAVPLPVDPRGPLPARQGFATFDEPASRFLVDAEGNPDFPAIQQTEEFKLLRRRVVRFVFPMTALFLVWYMTYVLLSAYAEDFMSQRVFGVVNVGLVLGLLQFASTVLIMLGYSRYAARALDPQVDVVRELAGADEEQR